MFVGELLIKPLLEGSSRLGPTPPLLRHWISSKEVILSEVWWRIGQSGRPAITARLQQGREILLERRRFLLAWFIGSLLRVRKETNSGES
jgi:hypothetical protein